MKQPWLHNYLGMTEGTDCCSTAPLVELIGTRRLLIENHMGVTQYGTEQISVKTKYGHIYVSGNCLSLLKMSREQLIVTGNIRCITVEEGM